MEKGNPSASSIPLAPLRSAKGEIPRCARNDMGRRNDGRWGELGDSGSALVHVDRLGFGEEFDGSLALLAGSTAGRFHAAEWHLRFNARCLAVDFDDSSLDSVCELHRRVEVTSEDASAKTVAHIVRDT